MQPNSKVWSAIDSTSVIEVSPRYHFSLRNYHTYISSEVNTLIRSKTLPLYQPVFSKCLPCGGMSVLQLTKFSSNLGYFSIFGIVCLTVYSVYNCLYCPSGCLYTLSEIVNGLSACLDFYPAVQTVCLNVNNFGFPFPFVTLIKVFVYVCLSACYKYCNFFSESFLRLLPRPYMGLGTTRFQMYPV